MEDLSEKLKKFDNEITGESLRTELLALASYWETLRTTPLEQYEIMYEEEEKKIRQ